MLERLGVVFFGLMLLGVTACVTSVESREVAIGATPDPTATPAPITFPEDELAHDSRLEWWYHSGHLESETGREFGFHFVVFKADDGLGEPNLVAQLGILDVETGEHYEFSRAEGGFNVPDQTPYTIQVADWISTILTTAGQQRWAASDGDMEISLQFEATTPVMLHNEIGWLPTEAGATYYYSWPRQKATGTLTLNGEAFNVTGTGWFDHQWGDFFVLGKPAGWQWFALQLSDGGSLMITQARGIDGKIDDTYGTYMSPEGKVRDLKTDADGIDLAAIGEWTSPVSGATYPSGWALVVDSLAMDLILIPVANDQEIEGGLAATSTYWEGKVRIGGLQNGQPIAGDAYVELSGYVDPEPIEWMHR